MYRIYKEIIPLEFEPAEDKHLELVHPQAHITRVKDTITNPKTPHRDLLEPRKNTFRF